MFARSLGELPSNVLGDLSPRARQRALSAELLAKRIDDGIHHFVAQHLAAAAADQLMEESLHLQKSRSPRAPPIADSAGGALKQFVVIKTTTVIRRRCVIAVASDK